MSDLVVARTTSVGPGGRRIQRGTVLCAQDPVVLARPQLFVPYNLRHHCGGGGVEQATAAPGERRDVHPAPEPQPADPKRPPKSGPGSGVEAWRAYVAGLPGSPPADELADLSRDELIDLAGD